MAAHSSHPHSIEFTIDGETYSTTEKTLTARQILVDHAGLDPTTHYLILLHGREQVSYETRPDEPIHMHEHQQFISAASVPTPVS
jgi:hypothetical protein